MTAGYTQTKNFLSVTTPFGTDELVLDEMKAFEGISEMFSLTLHMRSMDSGLDATKVIGNAITVKLEIPDGPKRYFNGIVTRFIQSGGEDGMANYSAEVVPKLWLLTLSTNRAIWQTKAVPDIIKDVLGEFGITFEANLTGTYTVLDYCVQHDETSFAFISRLMEAAGIFYFFTFKDGAHTMMLADATTAHITCTDAATVRFFPEAGTDHMIDTIASFELENRLVTMKHSQGDYDPLNPSTALDSTASGTVGKGEWLDWPGKHTSVATGNALSKLRVQASQLPAQELRGNGYVYPFTAGTKFTLTDHFRTSLNTSHVLRRVHHSARNDMYRNRFETFLATVPFRPPRLTPSPSVAGSQTAIVVGPANEEIWTDKEGRVKVQFFWDRVGAKDEKSSGWIRVAQSAAGKGYGTLFMPRVGQEVVISYIDADPDRPLITGSVYNGENTTPVTLPANQTQSVIKSRSSPKGTAGNEIRMEDKKDAEELYLHAQKDMKVEIENALTTTLTKGAEIHTLTEGDRTIELKKGKEIHKVKGTRALTVTGDETHDNEGKFTHTVEGNYTLKITGDLLLDIAGGITIKSAKTVLIEASTSLMAKAGTSLTNQAGTALTNQAGTALTNQAGTSLTNKASLGLVNEAGTTLDNKGAMMTHKASAMQTIDGGGMLIVKGGLVKIN
jgi:type VI secretion system secreted protein VgrG